MWPHSCADNRQELPQHTHHSAQGPRCGWRPANTRKVGCAQIQTGTRTDGDIGPDTTTQQTGKAPRRECAHLRLHTHTSRVTPPHTHRWVQVCTYTPRARRCTRTCTHSHPRVTHRHTDMHTHTPRSCTHRHAHTHTSRITHRQLYRQTQMCVHRYTQLTKTEHTHTQMCTY